jgi:hypothetical protein
MDIKSVRCGAGGTLLTPLQDFQKLTRTGGRARATLDSAQANQSPRNGPERCVVLDRDVDYRLQH